jgi:hypothetical protein
MRKAKTKNRHSLGNIGSLGGIGIIGVISRTKVNGSLGGWGGWGGRRFEMGFNAGEAPAFGPQFDEMLFHM